MRISKARRLAVRRVTVQVLLGLVLTFFVAGGFAIFGDLNTSTGKPAGLGTNATSAPGEHPYALHPGEQATNSGLQIQVVGKCSDKGGLRLKASGFTPNSEILVTAKFPDGSNYKYLPSGGVTYSDANGAIPDWSWDCNNTPGGFGRQAGTYSLTVKDTITTKSVSTTFIPWIASAAPSTSSTPSASN